MADKPFQPIIDFYSRLPAEHGDSADGVGWTDADAPLRYRTMLEAIRPGTARPSVLDFGCGAAHLLDHLQAHAPGSVDYHGIDVSEDAIALCRRKHPDASFECLDVLTAADDAWPAYDYILMNGIFTWKGPLTDEQMWDYLRDLLRRVFAHARVGVAFNVMSTQVDWRRDDLFHAALDPLVSFLSREVSRHVVVRADYGLYEYTVYVYREPGPGAPPHGRRLVGTT